MIKMKICINAKYPGEHIRASCIENATLGLCAMYGGNGCINYKDTKEINNDES